MTNNESERNYKPYHSFIAFLIFYMYMGFYGIYQIADKLAENPDNIIKSCMYYVREVKKEIIIM